MKRRMPSNTSEKKITRESSELASARVLTPLTAIDLFAGCGGLTYGLRGAKFNVVGALELDPVAAEAYRLNHKQTALKETDIRNVDGEEWMAELDLRPGQLDLLAGCPPCQGFSRLRTKNGARSNRDSRNRLLLEMARLVKAFRPKTVMMENVPGLERRTIFKNFLRELRRNGYSPRWEIHDVRKYGVPQRRRRLVLVAGRGFEVPFSAEAKTERTVRMTISGLKPAGRSGDRLHDMPENRTEGMKNRIALISKDGGSRSDLPNEMQLECHRRSDGFSDVYGRMAWDDISPTITGGCFNPSKGRFLHPQENRNITMREAALLQTFPKSFRLPLRTTKTDAAKMIGNALPPEFVRRQAKAIREAIEEQKKGIRSQG